MDQAVARGNPANPAAGRPKQGTRAKRLPVDERRRQLIELGIEIFSENPYEDISTSEIAEQARISKGLLYHYFPSKRHFFLETIREIGRRLDEATEWDPSLDFARAGYQSLRGYLDFVDANENMYRALVRSAIGTDPNVNTIAEERRQLAIDRILENLGLEDPTPLLRTGIHAWIGFCEAAVLSWLDHRDFPKQDLLAMLIAGFKPIQRTVRKRQAQSDR